MRTVTDLSREELEKTVADEISSARAEARPISRLTLSKLIQIKYALNPHDAEKFVDVYCDEKAPAVPTYLSNEFGVPYLKVLAVLQVVLAMGIFVFTMKFQRADLTIWPGLTLGLLFVAVAAFSWVQSLRPQTKQAPMRLAANDLPNLAVTGSDALEPASTGPLQTRS
ncbi:MAG: hypothetical protein QOJ65_554 [Fimbriimonadaceae bacterium]|jgi:hypothetical protein|nr:hypothetical protein [Fimbriimonadaceae bacterium]